MKFLISQTHNEIYRGLCYTHYDEVTLDELKSFFNGLSDVEPCIFNKAIERLMSLETVNFAVRSTTKNVYYIEVKIQVITDGIIFYQSV